MTLAEIKQRLADANPYTYKTASGVDKPLILDLPDDNNVIQHIDQIVEAAIEEHQWVRISHEEWFVIQMTYPFLKLWDLPAGITLLDLPPIRIKVLK